MILAMELIVIARVKVKVSLNQDHFYVYVRTTLVKARLSASHYCRIQYSDCLIYMLPSLVHLNAKRIRSYNTYMHKDAARPEEILYIC